VLRLLAACLLALQSATIPKPHPKGDLLAIEGPSLLISGWRADCSKMDESPECVVRSDPKLTPARIEIDREKVVVQLPSNCLNKGVWDVTVIPAEGETADGITRKAVGLTNKLMVNCSFEDAARISGLSDLISILVHLSQPRPKATSERSSPEGRR